MTSTLYVEEVKGRTSGANANKVIIPTGQSLLVDTIKHTNGTTALSFASDGTATGPNSNKRILITNNTTGGTASELVFDLSMETSYLYQRYIIEDVYSSGTGDVWWRSRRASDNTYFTGGSDYAYAYHYAASGGTSGTGSTGDSKGRLNGYGIGNASTEKRRWVIDVYDNSTSGSQTHVMWRNSGHYDGGVCDEIGMTMELATTTTNQWKMYNGSGGTLTYSGYVHYGITRA